jgi:hypothetical protein
LNYESFQILEKPSEDHQGGEDTVRHIDLKILLYVVVKRADGTIVGARAVKRKHKDLGKVLQTTSYERKCL